MSYDITKKLHFWILPKISKKICPEDRIPRTGIEGEKVDCYVINIDRNSEPYLLVKSIEESKAKCLKWNEALSRYCDEFVLEIDSIDDKELTIIHFYGLNTLQFSGIKSFLFHRIFFLKYIRVNISSFLQKISQYLFNKKKLISTTKIELLKFMLNDQLGRTHQGISTAHLMRKLYSVKIFSRPDFLSLHHKITFYLQALKISGDLELINNEYVVTGKAVTTLEIHEENERRHRESVILQWFIAMLTVGLLFFSASQAGAIKLPVLWDLTAKVEKSKESKEDVASSPIHQEHHQREIPNRSFEKEVINSLE